MKTFDYLREDTLNLTLLAEDNPLAAGPRGVAPVLEAVEEHAGGLTPDEFMIGKKRLPYSRESVVRLLDSADRNFKVILNLTRRAAPGAHYSLNFIRPGSTAESWLTLAAPLSYFAEPGREAERANELLALVRALAVPLQIVYGYAHARADLQLGEDPHESDPLAENKVYEAHWLNLYGARMIERLGRERVLSTPAARLEELPRGGVLLLTTDTPADYASEDARAAQARALAHLCDDTTFDRALERLRARSRTLAPVRRDWDTDIADLLELTLDSFSVSERQRETARLNDYRPPAVSEWRPFTELLPADVDDPDAEIERYGGLYAERLAALLRKDVPGVMKGGPDSLPHIDYHFWHFDYPGTFPREDIESDLVPSVGAYLGEVLVNHLGGHWVPRRNADESQVVIGERAWLPFLRARRYLRSKQSALDYSLTQFYRAAARSAGRDEVR